MLNKKLKTFADCAIYKKVDEAGFSTEKALVNFIMSADRIDISSNAFKGVVSQLKSRAQTALIVRMLQQGNVVLGMANKELSPSMKVFYAKDIKTSTKSKKVFVDVTNIITLQNGFFVCKNIDKLAAYLMGVMIMQVYYTDSNKFTTNGQKNATLFFVKICDGAPRIWRSGSWPRVSARCRWRRSSGHTLRRMRQRPIRGCRLPPPHREGRGRNRMRRGPCK